MTTEWKQIEGYTNYFVNRAGEVSSLRKDGSYRILKQLERNGYKRIGLFDNESRTYKNIHVLLAQAFIRRPDTDNEYIVDHKNGNKSDNDLGEDFDDEGYATGGNLRWATSSQNSMNRAVRSDNISGVVGVHFDKEKQKWRAYININYKRKNLGHYVTKEEAISARKLAQNEVFGEFQKIEQNNDVEEENKDSE